MPGFQRVSLGFQDSQVLDTGLELPALCEPGAFVLPVHAQMRPRNTPHISPSRGVSIGTLCDQPPRTYFLKYLKKKSLLEQFSNY